MMTYVTAGAQDRDGNRFKSKNALKKAIANNPSEVMFDITDMFHEGLASPLCADSLPEGVAVQVAGPDPYTKRSWFARVEPTASGPKVS